MGNNHVHVANTTDSTVKVLVAQNKDWVLADLIVGFAAKVIPGIEKIVAARAIVRAYKAAKRAGNTIEFFANIESMMKSHWINVAPHTVKDVHEQTMSNPFYYFMPSGLAAYFGGSDLSLAVLRINNDGTKQFAQFNTNSDWSWIIRRDRINRSIYGTLWMDNRTNDKQWQ